MIPTLLDASQPRPLATASKRGACKVCADPRRAEIDSQLLLGRPLRAVAGQFQIPLSTIGRHSQRHLKGPTERAIARVSEAYARNLRRYVEKIQNEVLSVLTSARTAGDSATALKAAAEARALADAARKILILPRTNEIKASKKRPGPPPEIEVAYMEGNSHVV